MIFKDINCGFYVQRRPLQYACLHDEVAALAERNQIVARAIYNYDKGADANERTRRYAAQSGAGGNDGMRLRIHAADNIEFFRPDGVAVRCASFAEWIELLNETDCG